MFVNSRLKATKIIGHVWAFSSKYWMFIHIYGVQSFFGNYVYFHFRFPTSRNINQKDQIKNKWKNKNNQ